MRPIDVVDAAEQLQAYIEAAKRGSKIFYGPLYSANDLRGLANQATMQLNSGNIQFFQVSEGGVPGQGFTRPLRFSETNLEGAQGSFPAGYSFISHSLGAWFPPELPLGLKSHLTRHSSIRTERMSNMWNAGALAFWPEASFGAQSQSVSTTQANSTVEFAVNGRVGARNFPKNAMLYFPANEIIKLLVVLFEDVFITTDGLTFNGGIAGVDPSGNGIPPEFGALLYLIMEGWRFEKLST